MRFLKSTLAGTIAVIVGIAPARVAVEPSRARGHRKTDSFMAQKRVQSQNILEALMTEDFKAIVVNGESMKAMKQDKRWDRSIADAYRHHSQNFEIQVQSMIDSARAENWDGAMQGYLKCLQTCYECHKFVRAEISAPKG